MFLCSLKDRRNAKYTKKRSQRNRPVEARADGTKGLPAQRLGCKDLIVRSKSGGETIRKPRMRTAPCSSICSSTKDRLSTSHREMNSSESSKRGDITSGSCSVSSRNDVITSSTFVVVVGGEQFIVLSFDCGLHTFRMNGNLGLETKHNRKRDLLSIASLLSWLVWQVAAIYSKRCS